jgi:uncharacterized protein YqgV (UPF0045/DUF77 family)
LYAARLPRFEKIFFMWLLFGLRHSLPSPSEESSPKYENLLIIFTTFILIKISNLTKQLQMNASIEISMYPLTNQYGTPILQFINRLKTYKDLTVISNSMSTQIFGPYDTLMEAIQKEMKTSFELQQNVVMVLKIANLDLRP